jgi:hypothetical protein
MGERERVERERLWNMSSFMRWREGRRERREEAGEVASKESR